MRLEIQRTINAWYYHRKHSTKNKSTDGHTIFYYGNPIARWVKNGDIHDNHIEPDGIAAFEINTCYHGDSKSTREYINNVIRFVYGDSNAPHLAVENGIIYMVHPESGEKNEWSDDANRANSNWFRFTDRENFNFSF
jgi:hypothetical protein